MSSAETHLVCRECGALDTIEVVPAGGSEGGGVYRCSGCRSQVGVWLDGGLLDLAIVRKAVAEDGGEAGAFEIFPLP